MMPTSKEEGTGPASMPQRGHQRIDPQLICEHRFYLVAPSLTKAPKRGDMILFYCEKCLLTIEKPAVDQSDKL